MVFKLPDLPYPTDALAPHMSKETLEFHHGMHHNSYVKNLNYLVNGTEFDGKSLEYIITHSSGTIFDNAAQIWNHTFYWNCLSPDIGIPSIELIDAMNSTFGSFHNFQEHFNKVAMMFFGSGWVWLVQNPSGGLGIVGTSNAGCPLTNDLTPLLTCDIWEHAYYIDHRNSRQKYLQAFWELVNWDFASTNFK